MATDHLKSLHTLERYGDGSMGQILKLKMSDRSVPSIMASQQSIIESTVAKNVSSVQLTKPAKPHHTSGPNKGLVMQARTFPSTCLACDEDHAIYSPVYILKCGEMKEPSST